MDKFKAFLDECHLIYDERETKHEHIMRCTLSNAVIIKISSTLLPNWVTINIEFAKDTSMASLRWLSETVFASFKVLRPCQLDVWENTSVRLEVTMTMPDKEQLGVLFTVLSNFTNLSAFSIL